MSSLTQGELEDAEAMLENVSHLESNGEVEKLSELSQELAISTEVLEGQERTLVIASQEDIEHEEEVVQSEAEIEPQEVEVQSEDQDAGLEETTEQKYKPAASVPPLRPLNIAPKPEQVPITVKSVSGQPLILVPGGSGGQAIKLVNQQGQEINLANYSLGRPITIKSSGKTMTSPVSQTQPKPILMKKIITTTSGHKSVAKPITFTKPNQQLVVVQKSGDQTQQVKLVQAAPVTNIAAGPITKTITLQQAQEMGLLGNAKIIQTGVQQVGTKRTVLINKNQPKTIKLIPQGSSNQVAGGVTKTISLAQFKSPTKILPASTTNITTSGKVPQRLIFKSAAGSQVIPAGQLIQVGGTQGIANGQIHQINVPGKGMQYIKFVTSNSGDASSNSVTVVNPVKSTSSSAPTTVMSDVKPIIAATKLVTKPGTSTKPTQVMLVPAGYIPANIQQVSKVAIPPVKQSVQQPKHVLATIPRASVPVTSASPENVSPSSTAATTISTNENSSNTNGIRPRKPCNCTKSQCLKLYCDCFANGEFCYLCNCMNCFNNLENEETRNLAIKACLERNSNAFRPKIGKAKDTTGDILRKHTKGCNCKRSGCLKNYCECYEAKIACSTNCKCVGCRNIEESFDKKSFDINASTQRVNDEQLTQTVYRKILPHYKSLDLSKDLLVSGRKKSSSRKQPITYITDEVIEATCQCLLTISDDADLNMQDEEITKRQIIEEFGGCLNEIIHCSMSRNVS